MVAFAVLIRPTDTAQANVISDWDAKALAFAAPGSTGEREVAMVHIAMFDAVNSIEQRYRPYLVQPSVPKTTSQEAAAATAAGTVLAGLPARRATAEMKTALATILLRSRTVRRRRTESSSGRRSPPRSWRRAQTTARTRPMPTDRERRRACMCPRRSRSARLGRR